MHAFVSYARVDVAAVEQLRDGLRLMGCQVWMDLQAGGGRDWWAEVLQSIRDCDLFVAVLCPAGLESLACTRKRQYGRSWQAHPSGPGGAVSAKILPPTLARLNIVDFSEPETFATGVRFTTAVRDGPAAPPRPDPLPPEPPIPLSYLAELGESVRAESLTFNYQMAAAARLRDALTRPEDHGDALVLIRAFADREDLYVRVHAQIQDLVTTARQPANRRERFPPAGAEIRRTLVGHTDAVWEMAFSPDGSLLATASRDGTPRI